MKALFEPLPLARDTAPILCDFLYPPATLAYLRQTWESRHVSRDKQARGFTSLAASSPPETELQIYSRKLDHCFFVGRFDGLSNLKTLPDEGEWQALIVADQRLGRHLEDGSEHVRNFNRALELNQRRDSRGSLKRIWRVWLALPEEQKTLARADLLVHALTASAQLVDHRRVLALVETKAFEAYLGPLKALQLSCKAHIILRHLQDAVSYHGQLLVACGHARRRPAKLLTEELIKALLPSEQGLLLLTVYNDRQLYERKHGTLQSPKAFADGLVEQLQDLPRLYTRIYHLLAFIKHNSPRLQSENTTSFARMLVRACIAPKERNLENDPGPSRILKLLYMAKSLGLADTKLYEKITAICLTKKWMKRHRFSQYEYPEFIRRLYRLYRQDTLVFQPTEGFMESVIIFARQQKMDGFLKLLRSDWQDFRGPLTIEAATQFMIWHASKGDRQEVMALFDKTAPIMKKMTWRVVINLLHVESMRGNPDGIEERLAWILQSYDLRPDISAYNILLHAYYRVQDFDNVMSTFQTVIQAKIKPDKYTYAILCAMAAERGDVDLTQRFRNMAITKNIGHRAIFDHSLVLAHIRAFQPKVAEQLAVRIQERYPYDTNTLIRVWAPLIWAYCAWDKPATALNLFRRISRRQKNKKALSKEPFWYATAIRCYMANRHYTPADNVLAVMRKHHVKPNALHFALQIQCCSDTRRFNKGMKVYAEFQKSGLRETLPLRLALLELTSKSSVQMQQNSRWNRPSVRFDLAEQLLEEFLQDKDPHHSLAFKGPGLESQGGSRDDIEAHYIGKILDLYASRGATEMVEMLLQRYEQILGTKPATARSWPLKILHHLMRQRHRQGRYEQVARSWDLIKQRALTMSSNVLGSDDKKVIQGGRLLLQQPLLTYVESLAEQDRFDLIVSTVGELDGLGFDIGNETLNFYVSALLKNGNHVEAFTVCEQRLLRGFRGWDWDQPKRQVGDKAPEYENIKLKDDVYRPHLGTLVVQWPTMQRLIAAYKSLQEHAFEDAWAQNKLEQIHDKAKRLVNVFKSVPSWATDKIEREKLMLERKPVARSGRVPLAVWRRRPGPGTIGRRSVAIKMRAVQREMAKEGLSLSASLTGPVYGLVAEGE